MAEVSLPNGMVALVDDEDLELVSGLAWYVDIYGYAQRRDISKGSRNHRVCMHRLIAKAADGEIVDHIDNNRLNNRRSNLRIATKSQNGCNTLKKRGTSSKHKGVTIKGNKWMASITVHQRYIYLGVFSAEDEAGHAYNKAAIQYFGEFACLNPIGVDK